VRFREDRLQRGFGREDRSSLSGRTNGGEVVVVQIILISDRWRGEVSSSSLGT
jgi:hypothetical protein